MNNEIPSNEFVSSESEISLYSVPKKDDTNVVDKKKEKEIKKQKNRTVNKRRNVMKRNKEKYKKHQGGQVKSWKKKNGKWYIENKRNNRRDGVHFKHVYQCKEGKTKKRFRKTRQDMWADCLNIRIGKLAIRNEIGRPSILKENGSILMDQLSFLWTGIWNARKSFLFHVHVIVYFSPVKLLKIWYNRTWDSAGKTT